MRTTDDWYYICKIFRKSHNIWNSRPIYEILYSKILEYEGSKENFLTLLGNKMKRSLIKYKDLYRYGEKVEHSNVQLIKVWLSVPQQGQNLGQSSETLPLLTAVVILYFYPALNIKIQLKPKLKWGYSRLSLSYRNSYL